MHHLVFKGVLNCTHTFFPLCYCMSVHCAPRCSLNLDMFSLDGSKLVAWRKQTVALKKVHQAHVIAAACSSDTTAQLCVNWVKFTNAKGDELWSYERKLKLIKFGSIWDELSCFSTLSFQNVTQFFSYQGCFLLFSFSRLPSPQTPSWIECWTETLSRE